MKSRTIIFLVLLSSLLLLNSCLEVADNIPEKTGPLNEQIDEYLIALIEADEIPGMAVAVVKNNQVLHKKNYGLANIAHAVPVTDSTLFRLYSTTKLITAVASFQLIEAGKISLNDPISRYIDDLPASWQSIRVEHLLTCSSGLPEYKDLGKELSDKELMTELGQQSLHFEEGYKYEYSQTNYWLLQLIIEKVSGQSFESFVKKNQFENRSNEVIFASNSLVDYRNRVSKYQYNKEYNAYEITTYEAGNRSLAGNGLNTSLNTLLDWNAKLDNHQLIEPETKRKMMSPFEYENNDFPFGYTWGIYGPEGKQYYGFAGGGVSAFMKFIDKDLTIIILSNGFKRRPVISDAITYISGLSDSSLIRQDRMLNEEVRLAFILKNYDDAMEIYLQKSSNNKEISFERGLNNVAYHYLSFNQNDKAIAILKLYTQDYPSSSNAFDSLAEAYYMNQQYDLAKKNYEKSLALDPNNNNAKEMLEEIKELD